MDQNDRKQQLKARLKSREAITGLVLFLLLAVLLVSFFSGQTTELAQDEQNYIRAQEMTEKEWKRIYTDNGERRSTHVYDFASTCRKLTFGSREYADGTLQTETFIGTVDWGEGSGVLEGEIDLSLKPSNGSVKIEVAEASEDAAVYEFSVATYPFLEDMVMVSYRQLGDSAIDPGREILLLEYAWDAPGTFGESQSDEELKQLQHYVEVYCIFEEKSDGTAI